MEDGEESACDGEADALGLGGGSELCLRIGGDFDRAALGVLEGLKSRVQSGELFVKQGELLQMAAGVEVAQGAVGLAIEALTRESALLGLLGDVAVLAEEDNRGTGESVERSYDGHG